MIISIHVPAWGTTEYLLSFHRQILISIHVPAWGTTVGVTIQVSDLRAFQSTFPRGERQRPRTLLCYDLHDFNPRSRVGND